MYTNVFILQKAARLTCVWVPTGNDRMPLTCVWVEAADSNRKQASSSNEEVGRMLLCA